MSNSLEELRRIFTSTSLGQMAYHTWALQARHERFFNIARLFEALSAAKQARAEHAFRALGEVGSTSDNVEWALAGLEPEAIATGPVTATSPLTRELLGSAQVALQQGRDLTADELGDIVVCRTCGELRVGAVSGACPICGTVLEAHRSFRVIEAMGVLGPHAIMAFLEKSEQAIRTLADGLDDSLLTHQLSNSQPSFKELVGHLIDVDTVFRSRAWLLLETDQPELAPGHPPRLDAAKGYRDQPFEAILGEFRQSRRQTLNLLRGLTNAAWHRTGHHELYGTINLLHQGNWTVSHERQHLIELAQIRHDLLHTDLPGSVVSDVSEGE
jgi:rubrerythrin